MTTEELIARARDPHVCVDALHRQLADALEVTLPRTVATIEELDALPEGSVVRMKPEDAERVELPDGSWEQGAVAEFRPDRTGRKAWFFVGRSLGFYSHQADLLPATVLYAPTPTGEPR
jgi:hypothetical protein